MRPAARPASSYAAGLGVALVAVALLAPAARAELRPGPEGYPARGRLGVEVQGMTAELREFFGAPPEHGVLVVRIVADLPAAQADLHVGDVILAASAEPIESPHDLVAIVARAPGGQPIPLTVVRGRDVLRLEVTPDGGPIPAEALDRWHEHVWGPPAEEPAGEAVVAPAAGGALADRLDRIEERLEAIEQALVGSERGDATTGSPAPAAPSAP